MSSWYSSGVFVLIVVVLTLVCAVVSDGVFSFITALFSSDTTLLVIYGGGGGGCDGSSVVLDIKPGVCGLGGYGPGSCGLPV